MFQSVCLRGGNSYVSAEGIILFSTKRTSCSGNEAQLRLRTTHGKSYKVTYCYVEKCSDQYDSSFMILITIVCNPCLHKGQFPVSGIFRAGGIQIIESCSAITIYSISERHFLPQTMEFPPARKTPLTGSQP